MMTPKRRRALGPALLATVGILVMLTGIGLHWWNPERHGEIEWIPQLIGAAIAFVGFYGMDPKGAKDGGAFIVDAGTRIFGMVQPGGRRATDPPVVTPVQPVDGTPLDERAIPPSGGFPPSEQPHDVAPLAAIPAKERGAL
jgi:hypothetical protein